jgi:tricorn protease
MRRLFVACVLAALGLDAAVASALTPPVIPDQINPENMRLLRQPDIHGDRIAFVHGGNLWIVPAAGGEPVRLTFHPARDRVVDWEPDGLWIACLSDRTGEYEVGLRPGDGKGPEKQVT